MPRIKRWSPISHDFNRDPQITEIRKRFGDWTALAWQEVLHEADRNDGIVRGNLQQIADRLAPISLQKYHKPAADCAQNMLKYITECGWIALESDYIEVVNYAKYHRTAEHKRAPSEPDLTRPNQTKPIKTPISPKGDDVEFQKTWEEYPKKVGKGAAEKAWVKIKPTAGTVDVILTAIRAQKQSEQWRKDGGQFIPHLATWLNQRRWEDEPTQAEPEVLDPIWQPVKLPQIKAK